jgi:hypothetical protein
MHRILLASTALLAAACGSKSKGPDTAGGGVTDDANVPSGPLAAGQWETLDDKTRGKWMGKVVLPTMKAKFQGFDADEFAEFDCETCHGSGAARGEFDMPNPELPQLTGDMIMNPDADHAAITKFMAEEIRPTMAHLLGRPEWSPDNPAGFGCFGCHTMQQ